jgi:hypothetical protein
VLRGGQCEPDDKGEANDRGSEVEYIIRDVKDSGCSGK